MTAKTFNRLWLDALEQPSQELFIGEYGYPDWFDEISQDAGELLEILGNIHDVAHMSIKDMVNLDGFKISGFSRRFCIPLRTVEDWVAERRKCPDYVRLMIAKELGFLKTKISKD